MLYIIHICEIDMEMHVFQNVSIYELFAAETIQVYLYFMKTCTMNLKDSVYCHGSLRNKGSVGANVFLILDSDW